MCSGNTQDMPVFCEPVILPVLKTKHSLQCFASIKTAYVIKSHGLAHRLRNNYLCTHHKICFQSTHLFLVSQNYHFKWQRTHLNVLSQHGSAVYFSVCIYEDKTDNRTVAPFHIQAWNVTTYYVCICKTSRSLGTERHLAHWMHHLVAVFPNSSAQHQQHFYLEVLSVPVTLLQAFHRFL